MYSSTKSGICCVYDFNIENDKDNCIGKTTVNATVLFVNEERKEICASKREPGYLAFIGPMNMKGYWWDDPKETAKVLQNGILFTNDVAYPDPDGDIIFLGRDCDVINVGGKKWHLRKLRTLLLI